MKLVNLIGQRFGYLTVIERVANGKCNEVRWLCKCDCGNHTEVSSVNLKNGHCKSCGCLKRNEPNYKTHGNSKHWLYSTWCNMKTRCYNPNSKDYNNYHNRGICVCDSWLKSFESFMEDVSKLPHYGEPGYTLDRVNNNGNYEPDNVRWATAKEQANNTRRVLCS